MPTAQITLTSTGTAAPTIYGPGNGYVTPNTMTGQISWPDTYQAPPSPQRWVTAQETLLNSVLNGMLSRDDALILTPEELAEKALDIVDAVRTASVKRGYAI